MKKSNRDKIFERIIRLTWESLESHLQYTHKHTSEGREFHRKCVKDYAETIELVSKLWITDTKD